MGDVQVPISWTIGRLESGRLERECLSHLGRGSMAVALDEPLAVVGLDETPR